MKLDDPHEFAQFIANTKLYMGLETSYGKSIETIVTGMYPLNATTGQFWEDPREKLAEFAVLKGLSRERKSQARNNSVWREIDRSCVYNKVRYLTSIKSGPNTINDTQVAGMKDAILQHHQEWFAASQANYGVERIDIVLGLTYGTPKTTNNKDIQIIVKLRESGFREENPNNAPGVLVDDASGLIRVYRAIGTGFWAFIANPESPSSVSFAFLEILVSLAIALKKVSALSTVEDRLNAKLAMLANAIANLRFPKGALPLWVQDELGERELFWLASAMTAFYDEGI